MNETSADRATVARHYDRMTKAQCASEYARLGGLSDTRGWRKDEIVSSIVTVILERRAAREQAAPALRPGNCPACGSHVCQCARNPFARPEHGPCPDAIASEATAAELARTPYALDEATHPEPIRPRPLAFRSADGTLLRRLGDL